MKLELRRSVSAALGIAVSILCIAASPAAFSSDSSVAPGVGSSTTSTGSDPNAGSAPIGAGGVTALSQIHHANLMEIQMAQLAQTKALNPSVKDFAQAMIKDHTAADQKVMDLAKSESLQLQAIPMTPEQKSQMNQLQNVSGRNFDRAFMAIMSQSHTKAVQMLSSSEKNVKNDQVSRLISELLPSIRRHHDMATSIAKNLDMSGQSSSAS